VLRSLSAERAYRWLNAGRMDPRGIADFLILDHRFPRSLAFCYAELGQHLASLDRLHGHESQCNRLLREAEGNLSGETTDSIFDQGLHEFLLAFTLANQAIANAISDDYRFIA